MDRPFSLRARATWLLCWLCLFLGHTASAQACFAELRASVNLSDEELFEDANGRHAARYLRRAVELLEPALPPTTSVSSYPVAEGDPGFADVRFLAGRGLLPTSWHAESLSVATWHEMLDRLANWYTPRPEAPRFDGINHRQLLVSLAALIEAIRPQLNPIALLASDTHDPSRLAFNAIIRNDSVHPRLIVLRPQRLDNQDARSPLRLLEALSSCAMALENYAFAPADTARELFLANNQSRMLLVASDPEASEVLGEVPAGQEVAYLEFSAEPLADLQSIAVAFTGPSPGVLTLTRLAMQLRTNMSVGQIIAFFNP